MNEKVIEMPAGDKESIGDLLHNAHYFYSVGSFDRAIDLYKEVLKQDRNNFNALLNMGVLFIETNRHRQTAKGYLIRATENNPDNYLGFYNLAYCHSLLGEFNQAIGRYKDAIDLEPSYADSYRGLASVYESLKDIDNAIHYYKEYLKFCQNEEDKRLILEKIKRLNN